LVALLHDYVAPVKSAVFSNPTSVSSTSSRLNEVLELLRKLMEYRSSEVRQRLEKIGHAASILRMDVLLLIYHFARFSEGNILEIGPYIGGSTIAAVFGTRDSGTRKTIVSIEAGGQLKHFRLSSRNIINDLRKNLARFGVAGDVSLINGRSFDEATISEVRQRLSNGDVGLFVFDADNNVRRDLDSYGELLNDGCWVVIDDYFGPAKAAPLRAQVDALVCEGRLVPFGYYGWGTWVGQCSGNDSGDRVAAGPRLPPRAPEKASRKSTPRNRLPSKAKPSRSTKLDVLGRNLTPLRSSRSFANDNPGLSPVAS
jgi:predicted O-methyltransferase YrrM